MKIDVCIVTKSPENAQSMLSRLRKASFTNSIIIETSTPLGLARMRAIQKVTTEWFVFFDDDIVVPNFEKWFIEIIRYISSNVAAIEGMALDVGLGEKWDHSINKYRLSTMHKSVELPNRKWSRGYTHNTLVRTDVVRDWKPSDSKLQAFEDLELTRHIQKKGYVWLQVPIVVFHPKTWSGVIKNAIWHGKTLHYCKLFTEKEKIIQMANWTLGLFIVLLDPRPKKPLRLKVRTVVANFFEIFRYFFGRM